MGRPLRIEYPGACYHVINRGNQRSTVFYDAGHYELFVQKLGVFAKQYDISVYLLFDAQSFSRLSPDTAGELESVYAGISNIVHREYESKA